MRVWGVGLYGGNAKSYRKSKWNMMWKLGVCRDVNGIGAVPR